jgi:hypothetical protein
MKAILATLLCYVFFQAQCFAHKGGPFEEGKGTFPTTGTFAGVLLPDPNISPFENSIGLFTAVFPKTGLGTGTLIIFQTGQTYTGTIQALIDPKGGAVSGLLYATFPYIKTVQTGTDDKGNPIFTTVNVVAVASGQLDAKVTRTSRLTGFADVQFSLTVNNVDSEVLYDVFGFKQA